MTNNGSNNKQPIHVVGIGGTYRAHSSSLFTLKRSLRAAESAGATTELLDLQALDLPMYQPGKSLETYEANVARFIEAAQRADAMLWSTAAYHGTLAGVTKNAIDFFQFLSDGEKPYLLDKAIGVITTAGGDMAAVNAANALVHSVHALRGTVVPLLVTIPQTWKVINPQEGFIDTKWQERLDQLGRLVVNTAVTLQTSHNFVKN